MTLDRPPLRVTGTDRFRGNLVAADRVVTSGGVAQLARALPLQGRGRGFDSHRLHQISDRTPWIPGGSSLSPRLAAFASILSLTRPPSAATVGPCWRCGPRASTAARNSRPMRWTLGSARSSARSAPRVPTSCWAGCVRTVPVSWFRVRSGQLRCSTEHHRATPGSTHRSTSTVTRQPSGAAQGVRTTVASRSAGTSTAGGAATWWV